MDQPAISVSRADPELLEFMRSTRPFERLSEGVLHRLCGRMTRVRVAAGQNLFETNDRGDAMYVLISGLATTVIEPERTTRDSPDDLGPGRLVGEIQFLVGGRRTATVGARVDSEFARLARSDLEAIADEAPQLIAALGDLIRRSLRREQLQRVLKDMLGELDD